MIVYLLSRFRSKFLTFLLSLGQMTPDMRNNAV